MTVTGKLPKCTEAQIFRTFLSPILRQHYCNNVVGVSHEQIHKLIVICLSRLPIVIKGLFQPNAILGVPEKCTSPRTCSICPHISPYQVSSRAMPALFERLHVPTNLSDFPFEASLVLLTAFKFGISYPVLCLAQPSLIIQSLGFELDATGNSLQGLYFCNGQE